MRSFWFRIVPWGWVLVFAGGLALAQAAPKPRTVLVELFTSEGCSSCPPADALLRKLDGLQTASGELVIGLSEHVTYWNQLGWSDPFSRDTWTARQNAYGERFRLDSVYTPQAVVNGEQQLVGSDGRGLLKAVQASRNGPLTLEIDQAKVAGGKVELKYTLGGSVPAGVEVWAVIADDMASSEVLRGENGGRRLMHASVARSLTSLGSAADGASTATVDSPEILKGQEKTGRHLVLFAQERGAGRVLAVESKVL